MVKPHFVSKYDPDLMHYFQLSIQSFFLVFFVLPMGEGLYVFRAQFVSKMPFHCIRKVTHRWFR